MNGERGWQAPARINSSARTANDLGPGRWAGQWSGYLVRTAAWSSHSAPRFGSSSSRWTRGRDSKEAGRRPGCLGRPLLRRPVAVEIVAYFGACDLAVPCHRRAGAVSEQREQGIDTWAVANLWRSTMMVGPLKLLMIPALASSCRPGRPDAAALRATSAASVWSGCGRSRQSWPRGDSQDRRLSTERRRAAVAVVVPRTVAAVASGELFDVKQLGRQQLPPPDGFRTSRSRGRLTFTYSCSARPSAPRDRRRGEAEVSQGTSRTRSSRGADGPSLVRLHATGGGDAEHRINGRCRHRGADADPPQGRRKLRRWN